MKRWIGIGGLIAVTATLMVVGGQAYREHRLGQGLERARSYLREHGFSLETDRTEWVGWNRLLLDSVRVFKDSVFSIEAFGLELELNYWAGGPLERIEKVSWVSLRCRFGSGMVDFQGELRPAQWSATIGWNMAPSMGEVEGRFSAARERSGALVYSIEMNPFWWSAEILGDTVVRMPSFVSKGVLTCDRGSLRLHQSMLLGGQLPIEGMASWEAFSGERELSIQVSKVPLASWVGAIPVGKSIQRDRLAQLSGLNMSLGLNFRHDSGSEKPFFSVEAESDTLDQLRRVFSGVPKFDHTTLPVAVVRAVLLAEDAGYWMHEGVDAEIMEAALYHNLAAGNVLRGGGTVTMQMVRNSLPLGHHKDLARKAEELVWALALEQGVLTKAEILDHYLAVIEWGPEVYGIEAASEYYFRKSPSHLTVDEGIFLASIIPNPKKFASQLNADGTLRPFSAAFHETIRWLLFEEGLVDEAFLDSDLPIFSELPSHIAA